MNGFCWNLVLLCTLSVDFRAFAQFKESEGSPGLFKDFEDGYIMV